MNQDSVVTTFENADAVCISPPSVSLPAMKAGSARNIGILSTVCM